MINERFDNFVSNTNSCTNNNNYDNKSICTTDIVTNANNDNDENDDNDNDENDNIENYINNN